IRTVRVNPGCGTKRARKCYPSGPNASSSFMAPNPNSVLDIRTPQPRAGCRDASWLYLFSRHADLRLCAEVVIATHSLAFSLHREEFKDDVPPPLFGIARPGVNRSRHGVFGSAVPICRR